MAKSKARSRSGGAAGNRTPRSLVLDGAVRFLILHGKESYLRSGYLQELRATIEQSLGAVDVIHFDGASTVPADILDEARSPGLMQQHKIIVVDQADAFLKTGRHREIMERYVVSPAEGATIVLRAENWNAGRLDKSAAKVGGVIKCDPPTPERARAFARQRCAKHHGCEITPAAADLLVERAGNVLSRLDSELARLATMVEPGRAIDVQLVRGNVPLSREERAWVIQSALLGGDAGFAVSKIRELLGVSRQPTVLLSHAMIDLARKLYTTAALQREGIDDRTIADRLRLWGPARYALPDVARGVDPPALAALMREAVAVDRRSKTGLGTFDRSLEMLVLRFLVVLAGDGR